MSRTSATPYEAACLEARKIVRGLAEELLRAVKDGEVTDEDDLHDYLHESADGALIYTADQWVCAYGLSSERDPFDEGLISAPKNFSEVLAIQAYCNLEDALSDAMRDALDALKVADDAREEHGDPRGEWDKPGMQD